LTVIHGDDISIFKNVDIIHACFRRLENNTVNALSCFLSLRSFIPKSGSEVSQYYDAIETRFHRFINRIGDFELERQPVSDPQQSFFYMRKCD
jgi:hypothetical protein